MRLQFSKPNKSVVPLHVIEQQDLETWLDKQPPNVANWVETNEFSAALGTCVLVPDANGHLEMVLAGYGSAVSRKRGRFHLASIAARLPAGDYEIASGLPEDLAEQEALGWLLSGYVFDRYAKIKQPAARLVAPEGVNAERVEAFANGEVLTRDLINTPASDMGPAELEAACAGLAKTHAADIAVIAGEALLEQGFPMIHAVGRAASQPPRLIDMRWGQTGPKLTLVGKGVCFDTGGLNLKPATSMGLMKKDMGGAATVLGLAHMIMALNLPVQLRVLIPAVENSVSASSFRPQDILTSRKGLTVEINNTDAEGRLVLADALAYAAEEKPDFLVSMATLTGAARVAVGPDLAPFYTDDTALAEAILASAARVGDPVWRMPFWEAYEADIEPGIADLDNAPKGGFAGSITAALFLRRFVGDDQKYVHFDIYGWQPNAAPARPKGGVGQGARALFDALQNGLGE